MRECRGKRDLQFFIIFGLAAGMLWAVVSGLAENAFAEALPWQTITPYSGATIRVYCVQPEEPKFGDEIVFYCEFEGCVREEFIYDWQYSDDGKYWTSFGSGRARRCFPLSETTAGKQVRLVVEER